jgi:hypothetical protein
MRIAIALTLAFFAVVSGMGAYRDLLRVIRDPRLTRYLGVITAAVVTLWSLYAACWIATH